VVYNVKPTYSGDVWSR